MASTEPVRLAPREMRQPRTREHDAPTEAAPTPSAWRPHALAPDRLPRGGARPGPGRDAMLRRAPGVAAAVASDELGGTAVDAETMAHLRRSRGTGAPLPTQLSDDFGPRLGVDLSAVRVHTGEVADRLSRSVQATAFTLGEDIYFSNGSFRPASPDGQRLIAHELAHVAQGVAGRSAGGAGGVTIGRADDPVERDADRIAAALIAPGPARADGPEDAGGADSTDGADGRAVRRRLAGGGTVIHRALGFGTMRNIFGRAKKPAPEEPTKDSYLNKLDEPDRLRHARQMKGSHNALAPDYSNPGAANLPATRFKITLAVAQSNPQWLADLSVLKREMVRQAVTSPQRAIRQGPSGLANASAQAVMGRREPGLDEETLRKRAEAMVSGLSEVGHTWVRLLTYADDRPKDVFTYGMYPRTLYSIEHDDSFGGFDTGAPMRAVPGQVLHPDIRHEHDEKDGPPEERTYKDYVVTEDQFYKALGLAAKRYDAPPPYVLTGYNCTKFTREVLQAAGKDFPGRGILPGFAFTPAKLYHAIVAEQQREQQAAPRGDAGGAAGGGAAAGAGRSWTRTTASPGTEAGKNFGSRGPAPKAVGSLADARMIDAAVYSAHDRTVQRQQEAYLRWLDGRFKLRDSPGVPVTISESTQIHYSDYLGADTSKGVVDGSDGLDGGVDWLYYESPTLLGRYQCVALLRGDGTRAIFVPIEELPRGTIRGLPEELLDEIEAGGGVARPLEEAFENNLVQWRSIVELGDETLDCFITDKPENVGAGTRPTRRMRGIDVRHHLRVVEIAADPTLRKDMCELRTDQYRFYVWRDELETFARRPGR